MTPALYFTALASIVVVLLMLGCYDLAQWLCDGETITEFLRDNPRAFLIPAGITVAFLAVLWLHLFA